MTIDLDAALRAADPARHLPGSRAADEEVLRSARAVVDARRSRTTTSWRRRAALVAAAAAAVTVGPLALSTVLDDETGRARGLPAAVAADGILTCGQDAVVATTSVPPADADLRLLPASLPAGWSLTRVFAREHAGSGSCGAPSLVTLTTGRGGTITARVSVTGPVQVQLEGEGVGGDTVAGRPASRFTPSPEEPEWNIWWWTDAAGRQWSAQVEGLPVEQAREVLRALGTDGDAPVWDTTVAPGFDVVHRGSSAVRTTTVPSSAWYLVLSDGASERSITIDHDPASVGLPVVASASPGSTVTTVAGLEAVMGPERSQWSEGDQEGPLESRLQVQLAPDTELDTTVRGDLPAVEALIASLTDVPASDRRLTELALDE